MKLDVTEDDALNRIVDRVNQVYSAEHDGQTGRHLSISIPDGVSTPTVLAGRAVLYVDQSDGDLKVIFSDGTIKTIVTDT
jgi:hypothetical protein